MPYFTICIPSYNRGYILHRALDSIKKQSYKDFETLIIDDGSLDETESIASEWISQNSGGGGTSHRREHYKYIKKKNGGKHTVLNLGIQEARGKFFIILDSDDWFAENALQRMHDMCASIENNDAFCGIMGRMQEHNGAIEGQLFDEKDLVSSYFDFHFVMKKQQGKRFNCVEANKTQLLKLFRYPEEDDMKFVPEAWLFDQLGIKYKLLLTNEVFQYSEYLPDGMNADKNFKQRHNKGFLYHYISRIENVLPYMRVPFTEEIKIKSVAWLQYWNCCEIDKQTNNSNGPRVTKVTYYGVLMKIFYPFVFFLAKRKFDR